MTNEWQQMVMDSLTRIEGKLDTKVDEKTCTLHHSGKSLSDFKSWLAVILSIFSLIGLLYTGFQMVEDHVQVDKQGVVDNG